MNYYQKIRMMDMMERNSKQPSSQTAFMVGLVFGILATFTVVGVALLFR